MPVVSVRFAQGPTDLAWCVAHDGWLDEAELRRKVEAREGSLSRKSARRHRPGCDLVSPYESRDNVRHGTILPNASRVRPSK